MTDDAENNVENHAVGVFLRIRRASLHRYLYLGYMTLMKIKYKAAIYFFLDFICKHTREQSHVQ